MNDFFIGLQFLSRFHFVKQTKWTAESFGRSVKFFPLVGAAVGAALALAAWLLVFLFPSFGVAVGVHLRSALLVFLWIALTGGLCCDGFIDTMDGLFSGRERERMLEIMKDSRVGANGVTAFALLLLMKWSALLDMPEENMVYALFSAPAIGRMAMVMGITLFPYARPEGIGKAFAAYANKNACLIAFFLLLLCLLPCGVQGYLVAAATLLFAYGFGVYATRLLGGLTGDVYGAVTELTEALVIALFLL